MGEVKLLLGDCLDKLKELEDNSVDSVVTDPPYEIRFMGKGWDDSGIANNPELWKEVLRVLKPGGHLLSFSHSRTYHRQAVAVEDAGFEIRDQIMWIYGSGFPKSHNIGKSVDKLNGIEIEKGDKFNVVGGTNASNGGSKFRSDHPDYVKYEAHNDWEGWGTALKPAHEPIVMARKPFKGTVAENVLEWGTGGINVDGCRIGTDGGTKKVNTDECEDSNGIYCDGLNGGTVSFVDGLGRFPANIIFECICDNPKVVADKYDIRTYNDYKNTFQSYEENDKEKGKYEIKDVETTKVIHTDPNCPCYILDKQSGITSQGHWPKGKTTGFGEFGGGESTYEGVGPKDTIKGGASRFFYCPKASKKDRNEGCDELEEKMSAHSVADKCGKCGKFLGASANVCNCEEPERVGISSKNNHPTVKPTDLMAYLIRLVTPKGGVVLDPFMGSGSTGKAAVREGMNFIGIEREEEYMEIAKSRIEHEQKGNKHQQFWTL
jgi:site-specific DNA-methyltransferase (adenine-specific)